MDKKTSVVIVVMGRPGHFVEVMSGAWIRLYGQTVDVTYNEARQRVETVTPYSKTFRIGEMAEVGALNLRYIARIVAITERSVTLKNECQGTRRLGIYEFEWRNFKFVLEEALVENSKESLYI
jgi:hypothetical protein